jgi:multiple sugar transport system permease protein
MVMASAGKDSALQGREHSGSGRSLWSYASQGAIWLVLIVMAVVEIAPISWLFATSLRNPPDSLRLPPSFLPTAWHWENYLAVIASKGLNFPLFFWNSFRIASIATIMQLLICSLAAFAFARLRFPGRDLLFFIFLTLMMVPSTVTVVPLFVLMRGLSLMDTHWALILPRIASAFGVFMLRQHFMTLPDELVEAARMDGAGYLRIYAQIMLPLVGPGLSALGVFTFLNSWNDYLGPLLFLRSRDNFTLPLGIVSLQSYMGTGNRAHVLAAVMMSILPVMLVFIFGQRFIIRGIALTGLK